MRRPGSFGPLALILALCSAAAAVHAQGLQSERALREQAAAAAAKAPGESAAAVSLGIAVLTPAVTPRIVVADHEDYFEDLLGLASVVKMQRGDRLTAQAARRGFDPVSSLRDHLLDALRRAGAEPRAVDVSRAGAKPISRATFPFEQVAAMPYVLDVTVTNLGLRQSDAFMFGMLYPAVYATYRVFDREGAVAQLSKAVMVNMTGPRRPSGFSGEDRGPLPEDALLPDPTCKFRTSFRKDEGTDRLWTCLDGALKQVAEAIAADPLLSDIRTVDGSPATSR